MAKCETKYFIGFLLPVFLLFIASCTESYTAENKITGQLTLLLHKQDAVDLYVRFDLTEDVDSSQQITQQATIASSGFKKITEHPIHFSLIYSPEKINQQKQYKLFVVVAEDPQGNNEISSMSSPVLTQGHPSTLIMAMQPLVEPVE